MQSVKNGVKMNILYVSDNNYAWLMGISMISLFENNKHIEKLDVYFFCENVTDENKKIIADIADRYHRKIVIADMPDIDVPQNLITDRWPKCVFVRLFADQILPKELDRVLYLDCDTIVEGSITPLEQIDMQGKMFYGVKDCLSGTNKENIGLKKEDVYINTGVLMINLQELRANDMNSAIESYVNAYKNLINYPDQDTLNGAFNDKIGILEPQYGVMTLNAAHAYSEVMMLRHPSNFYTEKQMNAAVEHPVIIHYTTNMREVRPWFKNSNHPYVAYFRKYMAISPWKDRELVDMHFTSKSDQIIGILEKLPGKMGTASLGFIHAYLRPMVVRMKAKIAKKG